MANPRTKIIPTVGPASADVATLAAMARAGADVFRINGAHAAPEELPGWVQKIRRAGKEAGCVVGVMVDLPGTKIRLGAFDEGAEVVLRKGQTVRLDPARKGGTETRLPIRSLSDLSTVDLDGQVLMADGRVRLKVIGRDGKSLTARVLDGGAVGEGTGVDFPGARLPTKVPTRRDREIARAAIRAGADMLALSFVRCADDVKRLRRLLATEGDREFPVVVKIERLDAIENLADILPHANVAIVARGDLGVDAGPERVPTLQKEIIKTCRRLGRPVLVATEMLESMITKRRPTRAEASDAAGAVFEGADAVMLSAETAVGKHPALVVRTMSRILAAAEQDPSAPYAGDRRYVPPQILKGRFDQHVTHAAVQLAHQANARAVVVYSRTGATAVRVSKERPRAPIIAFSPTDAICRRITIAWGVRPHRLSGARNSDALVEAIRDHLHQIEKLPRGAQAVLVMGAPDDPAGATSQIRMLTV